ncbi:MAG: acetate--CoA ligase family protein [Pseudomonadota bacterium]
MIRDLSRLFEPHSIAVIGGGWGASVIAALQRAGYTGDVWPIHPRRAALEGLQALASIDDLPQPPDAAFLAINRAAAIEAVARLAAIGAGGAVCFASGFAETGAGDEQARLIAAAGDMPLLGPNCYGLIGTARGVSLWPDQHGLRPAARGVALISHSSNIAVNWTMQARGLPVAHVVCTGNEAQIDMAEIGGALLARPEVTALGLYIEGIRDADRFAAMAEAAQTARKPVVAIKAGQTAGAEAAAASHTAALTGGGVASSAFLRQCGVAELDDPASLLEALKLAHLFGRIPGRRMAAMACSGGEAGLLADRLGAARLASPAIPETRAARLSERLGPMVRIANPLDYHTGIWGDARAMTEVFAAMAGPEVDLTLLVCDMPHPGRCDSRDWAPAVAALEAASAQSGARMAMLATLPEGLPEPLADRLMQAGIAPLAGLGDGIAAISAMAGALTMTRGWRPLPRHPDRATRTLDEAEAKRRLSASGLTVPEGGRAETVAAARAQAAALGGRVALKGLGFSHKSEAGAVRLDLTAAEIAPMQAAQGYLVERMVEGGIAELLIGLRRDPVYGAHLTLGLGGVTAELLADTATLILPATDRDIRQALADLRLAPLLTGHRGRPPADLDAALAAIARLVALFVAVPDLAEIEINPLILRPAGQDRADRSPPAQAPPAQGPSTLSPQTQAPQRPTRADGFGQNGGAVVADALIRIYKEESET